MVFMSTANTRILVVDDEEIVRESLAGWLEKDGYTVGVAPDGATAISRIEKESWSILLADIKMPGIDGLQVLKRAKEVSPSTTMVIMTAYATVETAVSAMKLGAYDYLVKPFDPEELTVMIRRIVRQDELVHENETLRRALRREYHFRDLISKNPSMQALFELTRTAARSQSTILVFGESGTGKELLARAIHAESPRSAGPFVAISCAALTETLLESELFGHEKGAFTGAVARRRGAFETAHGGTLFLDEIGDISPKLQMDLLRVLEERRFCRVGGTEPIEVDVRVIAATNRNLQQAVAGGSFRDDLFYRLNVIPITLPPLRERVEDIPLLVDHFVERMSAEMGRKLDGVSREAIAALLDYPFPGNVRELRNIVERAMVCAPGPLLLPADFRLPGAEAQAPPPATPATLEEVERRHITSVLEQMNGNISQAARVLGVDRATLYNKMRRYGLREPAGTIHEP
jgi:two-component system, NtrC family, response regulator AtoC